MNSSLTKPIVYKARIGVRFADLDPYGHVNASHYLDYVVTSRFRYAAESLNVTERTLLEKKIAFYTARANVNFRRPILGAVDIVASSHVTEIIDHKVLVSFKITSVDGTTDHADGELDYVVIDLSTKRPVPADDWVRSLFFEAAT